VRDYGFRQDSAVDQARFAERVGLVFGPEVIGRISKLPTPLERAVAIANLLYSPDNLTVNTCGTLDDMVEKVAAMRAGYGCCSDFSQVFVALAGIVGLPARQVQNANHGLDEFWSESDQRWVLIDVQLRLLARADGRLLSLWEAHQRIGNHQPVEWLTLEQTPADMSAEVMVESYGDAHHMLVVTLGSNFLEVDRASAARRWLPKAFRHLLHYLSGTRPRYLALDDELSASACRRLRAWAWAGKILLVLVTAGLLTLGYLVRRLRRAKASPTMLVATAEE